MLHIVKSYAKKYLVRSWKLYIKVMFITKICW